MVEHGQYAQAMMTCDFVLTPLPMASEQFHLPNFTQTAWFNTFQALLNSAVHWDHLPKLIFKKKKKLPLQQIKHDEIQIKVSWLEYYTEVLLFWILYLEYPESPFQLIFISAYIH